MHLSSDDDENDDADDEDDDADEVDAPNAQHLYLFRLQFSGQFHEAYRVLLRAILRMRRFRRARGRELQSRHLGDAVREHRLRGAGRLQRGALQSELRLQRRHLRCRQREPVGRVQRHRDADVQFLLSIAHLASERVGSEDQKL